MIQKIVKADGTILQNIKSCTYSEDVNGQTSLRPGCVSSAHIQVSVFGTKSTAVQAGDVLTYYQVDAEGNETKIGVFYAEPSINSRMTYKFTAYDAAAKLDADFSARLEELQSSFPMTLSALVTEAATVAGCTLASTTFPLSTLSIQAFYADNLSCREIISWAAEIAGRFVRCNADGALEFAWYQTVPQYRIAPSATKAPMIIAETGDIDAATARNVTMRIIATGADLSYQWQYCGQDETIWQDSPATGNQTPSLTLQATNNRIGNRYRCVVTNTYGEAISTPVLLNRASPTNVPTLPSILYQIDETRIAYKQNGLSYDNFDVLAVDQVTVHSAEDEAVSYSYPATATGANEYHVYNNLLVYGADESTFTAIATQIYTAINSIPQYRVARARLFPSENPLRAGVAVPVTDAQGVSFTMLVMSLTVDAAVAIVGSTGFESYEEQPQSTTERKLSNLSANVLRVKKLIADSIQAVIATIDNLFTQEITVTGSLHSPDYQVVTDPVYGEKQPYAASGLGVEFDDDSINGQFFSVNGRGDVFARSAFFGDFYFVDALGSGDTEFNIAPYQVLDSSDNVTTNYQSIDISQIIANEYDDLYPRRRMGINGYISDEDCTFVYQVPLFNEFVRYLDFNALKNVSDTEQLDPPSATVTLHNGSRIETQGAVNLQLGTFTGDAQFADLKSYKDTLFYPLLPASLSQGDYLQVEVSVPAGYALSLDVVKGHYSAWYGWNNKQASSIINKGAYGGAGTYVGTDGISAPKMAINGETVLTTDDIFYKSGDVISVDAVTPLTAQYVHGVSTIRLSITTAKRLDNITSITIGTLTAAVYGINGALEGATGQKNWLTSNYTVTAIIRNSNTIMITIKKSSGNMTNGVNYTPINAAGVYSLTLS